jgi:thymidylate synthase (FAD)
MELIPQSIEVIDPATAEDWTRQFKKVERAYRVCYKSEDSITADSWQDFIPKHLSHESPLEHVSVTVLISCSRAIQQELTRHRLAAYSIESTRWIDYFKKLSGSIKFTQSSKWADFSEVQREAFINAFQRAEDSYNELRSLGVAAQFARDVLPLSLKSDILCTMNVRQWRHVFQERALNKAAHPDIREMMTHLLEKLKSAASVFFDDLS